MEKVTARRNVASQRRAGATPGALPTANGEGNIETLKKVVNQYHDGVGPYMVAEFYPGWLSHWAEPFPAVSAEQVAKQTPKKSRNKTNRRKTSALCSKKLKQ